MLSSMSTDFGDLGERLAASGLFAEVIPFEEKDYTYWPELVDLKRDRGNIVANMLQRVRFCRRLGELEAAFVPVDLARYDDIYVFCDSDPIGYYLTYRRIRYHAVEDGLNCLRYRDTAREDNRGAFPVKALMARLGLIHIQNGYSRYCIDMEVNDLSAIAHPTRNMIEVPREEMVDRLTEEDKARLVGLFVENRVELTDALHDAQAAGRPVVLILTEPLCQDLTARVQLFRDMIAEYGTVDGAAAQIVIKPHPRDPVNYHEAFPEHIILDSHFPMEILNFLGAVFDRVVTVYTVPSSLHCVRESVYLGNAWMDRYEDPALHAHVTNAAFQVTRYEL